MSKVNWPQSIIDTEESFDATHIKKEMLNCLESEFQNAFIDYKIALNSNDVPVLLENDAGVPEDNDANSNLDIFSMLDLHYEADAEEVACVPIRMKGKSPLLKNQWQCPQCDYATPVKQYITQHIRRHTGEKPFKCNLCDYRAAQKQSVTYHMRRHTGEKPFKCTHCDYCSSSRQNLDRHIRRHTGKLPYGCPYCSYRSITKGPVVDHMRAKHGEMECSKALVVKLEHKNEGELVGENE